MPTRKVIDETKLDKIVTDAARAKRERDGGYREQALRMYPWICGRCAREFARANLHELTVHHRNHNYNDNPSDGSNWELLCLFCHDNKHQRQVELGSSMGLDDSVKSATSNPFAGLAALINSRKS